MKPNRDGDCDFPFHPNEMEMKGIPFVVQDHSYGTSLSKNPIISGNNNQWDKLPTVFKGLFYGAEIDSKESLQ